VAEHGLCHAHIVGRPAVAATEPLEAASIDGANRLQAFWLVTLPMLRPYILVALLLRTIFEFRAFDNIYAMTGGGPATRQWCCRCTPTW